MDKKTIVVCGATGNVGGAVVESLLKKKIWKVIALTRKPDAPKAIALQDKGAKLLKADLQNRSSMITAFEGAQLVFGITQPFSSDYKKTDPDAEIQQGHNIIDSCVTNNIEHIVFSTVFGSGDHKTGVPHLDSKLTIVDYLKTTTLPYTILKPASFMDNIGRKYFPVKTGYVKGFTDGDVKVPYISVADIGEFAAMAFEQKECFRNVEINLMADLVSGNDIAKTLSRIRNGETFKYKAMPRLLMKLFASEFYAMRVSFEKSGRPPYPPEYAEALQKCRDLRPDLINIEQFLISQGYKVKQL